MVARRACVFCGASDGHAPAYREAAREVGLELARRGITLVFGGGRAGLMGAVADAVLETGGQAIGVIPEALRDRELAHPHVGDMRVVPDMHTRKALMTELADVIVTLPGGYGTFDELLEAITWSQLGFLRKPIGLVDTEQFFQPFVRLIEHAHVEGFIGQDDRRLVHVSSDPRHLIGCLTREI